jgi:WD40 repeat protein/DNA-binding SARP family transcriptional activator
MDFRILGPLEVISDRGVVRLGGQKLRALLTVLLLNANEPVSGERLALALWGEEAPSGAIRTVHVYVSRLRTALGDAAIVTTTPAGYCLRVGPDELDAKRFERLVEDGHRALDDGRPEQAAALLRHALALWRGPPLADLAFERFAVAEIARLEEQRLTALETRIEADLAAGHHAEVVGELQQLVAAHPRRERVACQLMLALYRCGRQADALEVYRAVRSELVAEIGVEPGPQLRHLQEAILRQDVALEAQAVAELPPELDASMTPPLVGRHKELTRLRLCWERARAGVGGLVTLAGVSGSGKLRLAAELATAVHDGGDVVLYASGSAPTEEILTTLRRMRQTTRPTLLVVHAAHHASSAALTELQVLSEDLENRPVLVVACCEDVEALADLRSDDVLMLKALDAAAVGTIARQYVRGIVAEDVPVEWLLEASGGIPRVIHQVASQWARREATWRVGAVAERAAAGHERLRLLQAQLTDGVEDLQEVHERIVPPRWDAPIVCPFKGLASFDVDDAPYFFGREKLVAELVARLVGSQLLGIVGPSGSGKSSVMRAGLLPALASAVLPGSDRWKQVIMRPGEHPLNELTDAMAAIEGGERAVIAVDQFEETFTMCEDEAERTMFVAELGRVLSEADGRLVVVIALRADFYGRCAAYPPLRGELASNHVLVGAMQRDELRRAIELPAQRVGLRADPELTYALVADVRDEPGALPLLSTALLELWQHRDGRRLRYTVYEQTGGVRGAVARLAEEAFGELDDEQQVLARAVLMRLAGEGPVGGVERRRVTLAELETDRHEGVARVVKLLTDRRLLTSSSGAIELAHEALLREWPRLRNWIDADREGLRIHRNLSAAAREWEQLGRDDGALYRGTRLTETSEWNDAQQPRLNEIESAFLAASEARLTHDRAAHRRRIRLIGATVTTLAAAAVAVVLTVVFAHRERDITASRDLATKSSTLIASDPALGLAVALEALKRHKTEQAQNAVRQATYANRETRIWHAASGIVFSTEVSPDGRRLATSGEDGDVHIWRLDRERRVFTIKASAAPVLHASFSPDGERVASVSVNGEVTVIDVRHRRRSVVLRLSGDDYARSVQFSPDARSLLVGTVSGVVGLVQISDGPAALREVGRHTERIRARFDSSGTRIVSAGEDDVARIWTLAGGSPIELQHPDDVLDATFAPDGRQVATAGADGNVRIWNASSSHLVRRIHVDDNKLLSVRFSPDGREVITAGEDGVVRVTDVRRGQLLSELKGHAGAAYDAVFVRGVSGVMSGGEDGTLRAWEPLRVQTVPIDAHGHAPDTISLSPDAKHAVTGYSNGDVRLQDLATGTSTKLPGHHTPINVRYSTNGAWIISASEDGEVQLWDVKRRRSRRIPSPPGAKYAVAVDKNARRVAIATLDAETVMQAPDGRDRMRLRGHGSDVRSLAFSPDGKHLVSASEDKTARIWATADAAQETILHHDKTVVYATYSWDNNFVATADTDGTTRIWPVAGGRPVALYGHEGQVNSVEFDRSGKRLVTAGQDRTTRIWDNSGKEALLALRSNDKNTLAATFSPDGKQVLSAKANGLLRISPCEVCGPFPTVLALARSRFHPRLTASERQRLSRDR